MDTDTKSEEVHKMILHEVMNNEFSMVDTREMIRCGQKILSFPTENVDGDCSSCRVFATKTRAEQGHET